MELELAAAARLVVAKVSVLQGKHTCTSSSTVSGTTATQAWVANKAIPILRRNPTIGAKDLKKKLQDDYKARTSSDHFDLARTSCQVPKNTQASSVAMAGSSDVPASARKLEGKVVLITGGASGIGESTARLFVKHGASVVIADIQDDLGARLCAELGPAACSYVRCDVTSEVDVAGAVDHAVARFGKLDIMFNNAGIGGAPCHSIRESSKEDFELVLAVNLVGPFLGTKHAARVMVPARGGCIIGTSSLAGAVAGAASHAYTCAKRALVALTQNAAAELGRHGIRVNCVSPAAAATPLATGYVGLDGEAFEQAMEAVANLKGVRLRVEDVAAAVLFLASDDARYVSGHNLLIDGGMSVVNPSFGIFEN